MNDRVRELLLHLETAAEDAISFTAGTTQSDFADDKRTQQAVIMSLVIVGEVSSKLIATAPDFVAAHPEIPWRSMRGMRNRVIHG